MSWRDLRVAPDGTHHVNAGGESAYRERFDEVLKFHAPGLAPVRRGDQSWHIEADGAARYARRFARTFGYYEGLAAVTTQEGWHHIAVDGSDAYAARYAWCGNMQGGRCTVRESGGAYLHIHPDGSPVYRARWRYAGDYRDAIAVVQADDGRSSHIDGQGGLVHGRWFIDLDVFHKGFARARDEAGWVHIDAQGRPAYLRRFASIEPFYNGQARVERLDGALEVIDERGACLVELRPPHRSELAALSGDMVGFWRTQTIAAAVQLGVIEALPTTEAELTARCNLDPGRARRLLRALGELELTTCEGGSWELTPRGQLLRADHPLTLADAALEYAGPFSSMWAGLPEALRATSSGWTAPDAFGEVARDAERRAGHHRMLQSYARHDYAEVCRVLDLRGEERVIDAGGGLGVLGQLILDAYPSAQVTVLERPEVIELASSQNPGIQWRAADFFKPWGLDADVVLLSRVLHDWDDTAALHILEQARAALPNGGRVFVIEMLIPEESVAGGLCDLHLLMATGGQERSAAELRLLLEAAGFRFEGVRTWGALPSVLVGIAS